MLSRKQCFETLCISHLLSWSLENINNYKEALSYKSLGTSAVQRKDKQLLTTQQRSGRTPASCWRQVRWSRRAWSPGWRSRWTGTDTPAGRISPRRSSTARAHCLLLESSWLQANNKNRHQNYITGKYVTIWKLSFLILTYQGCCRILPACRLGWRWASGWGPSESEHHCSSGSFGPSADRRQEEIF